MLSYSKNILAALTGKTSLQDVSIEQLKQLADTYPYFAATQFFLSKKMFDDKVEGFENALQKTALHFDNTLLLHFSLHEEAADVDIHQSFIIKENIDETDNTNDTEINQATGPYKPEPLIGHEQNDQPDDEISEEETAETTNEITGEDELNSNEKLSRLLKEQAEAFEKPVEAVALPIEIIPHHRIDYFESQGIKLDPEKEANDKLGTQLKRFTDWLKQMKRINPNLNNLETDVAGEINAQNMAARSNDAKEVVTETMAEVLIKQGKPDEAIAIYEKLSFSNPSKSAYFAAKITELKA